MIRPVTYIKFPIYVQQFLRQRYTKGGSESHEPVTLDPFMHDGGKYLYRYLDSNARVQPWTMLSVSQQIFDMHPSVAPMEFLHVLPPVEYRQLYLPFIIQPQHCYKGRLVPGDQTAQLREENAQEFRKIMMREFWGEFDKFSDHFRTNTNMPRKDRENFSLMLQSFMETWDIDVMLEDSLKRVCNRRLHNEREKSSINKS